MYFTVFEQRAASRLAEDSDLKPQLLKSVNNRSRRVQDDGGSCL